MDQFLNKENINNENKINVNGKITNYQMNNKNENNIELDKIKNVNKENIYVDIKNKKTSESSREKIIKDKIENELFYEAHQMIKSLINRKLLKKEVNKCIQILFYFSSKFVNKKEYILMCDLMYQCIVILMNNNIEFNLQYASKIINMFIKCPAKTTDEKFKFMNKAITWSKNQERKYGYLEFHKVLAEAYVSEQSYALANNHFLFLNDNKYLYDVLCLWMKEGYPSEKDFFILRNVLSLIILKKFEQALNLINLFEPNLDKKDVSLPIQLAYLITCACIYNSLNLYENVKHRYRLIINYDPNLQKYIDEIDISIFNKTKNDIFSMITNIFK